MYALRSFLEAALFVNLSSATLFIRLLVYSYFVSVGIGAKNDIPPAITHYTIQNRASVKTGWRLA